MGNAPTFLEFVDDATAVIKYEGPKICLSCIYSWNLRKLVSIFRTFKLLLVLFYNLPGAIEKRN